MKRSTLIAVMMLVVAVSQIAIADGIQIGACAAFPGGGDVNNGELGGGVQGVVPVVGPIDLELSVSRFNDSLDITKMSLLQFAATLRYNYELSKSSKVYIGGGIDYNQMTADIIGGAVKVQMENVVGYHGTIGLETVVKKSWVLFLDCRFTKLATTAVVSGNGQSEVVEGTYDHGLLRAGVNFLF